MPAEAGIHDTGHVRAEGCVDPRLRGDDVLSLRDALGAIDVIAAEAAIHGTLNA
jgi:hypothetical protein